MKILVATDSFKGSLTTAQAAAAMRRGALRVFPAAETLMLPVADGGEGTVETLLAALGGRRCTAAVTGPNGGRVQAGYGILPDGTAVLEMAAASGLTLACEPKDVLHAGTRGTGELLRAALDAGCRRILLGIGGSATNDGGAGMAQALGVSLRDAQGRELAPGGAALARLAQIDLSGLDARVRAAQITVMCDVRSPLCGPAGASAVYGPQKGASPAQAAELDACLGHWADLLAAALGRDWRDVPGAGAAGGLGFGAMALLGAQLRPGIEAVLDAAGFDEKLAWADLVLTGEGRIDRQSVCGKVIDGIAARAAKAGRPVIAVAGGLAAGLQPVYDAGVWTAEAACCRPMTVEQACADADTLVADASERVLRAVRTGLLLAQKGKKGDLS